MLGLLIMIGVVGAFALLVFGFGKLVSSGRVYDGDDFSRAERSETWTRSEEDIDELPPSRRIPVLGATPWGGLLVECADARVVLVVLPTMERPNELVVPTHDLAPLVDSVVFVNDPELGGMLFGSEIKERLGLGGKTIYATADAPIDRYPGCESPRRANALPKTLHRGDLHLRQVEQGVLSARWRFVDGRRCALIGCGVRLTHIADALPQQVVGTVDLQTAHLAALTELGAGSCNFLLLEQVPPGNVDAHAQALAAIGFDTTLVSDAGPD